MKPWARGVFLQRQQCVQRRWAQGEQSPIAGACGQLPVAGRELRDAGRAASTEPVRQPEKSGLDPSGSGKPLAQFRQESAIIWLTLLKFCLASVQRMVRFIGGK